MSKKKTKGEATATRAAPSALPTVDVTGLHASTFFDAYINPRLPVKLHGTIEDSTWKGALWTNDYLKKKAGDATVRVEYRDSLTESFGRGRELKMKFGAFVDALGDDGSGRSYYLTTQELTYSAEGQPSITSPPVDGLLGDFPWRPALMGNLVPQNINVWFGSSRQPTSSGLHHDFHDNLYILLRGEKDVTLISPDEAAALYTHGEIARVHPNGRINYVGQPTNADGSDASSLRALQASARLAAAAQVLDEDEEEGERQIDDALEALLDAERAGMGDDDDAEDAEDEEDDDDGGDNDDDHDDADDDDNEDGEGKGLASASTSSAQPPNFSRVDTTLPDNELQERFPLYYELITRPCSSSGSSSSSSSSSSSGGAKGPGKRGLEGGTPHHYHVTVNAGEMLYIPAGWFHEVRSVGGGAEGHLAFNYWFHPPDGDSFERPYTTDFWQKDWEARSLT